MLVDQKPVQGSGAEYSLEIEKHDGSSLALDVSKQGEDYLAQLRQGPQAFKISQATFKNLFEGLDKLSTSQEQEGQE